ncbi:MAG: hypothetical protein OXG19_06705 [Chloroflexi bacterium]|nr:hypothetical protein [Chloroflexota bacterium]
MTTDANTHPDALTITYVERSLGFGGDDAATFLVDRPGHPKAEYDLRLAMDALDLFQAKTGELDADQRQGLLQALAARVYPRLFSGEQRLVAIAVVRARDIAPSEVDDILADAGLQ